VKGKLYNNKNRFVLET